MSQGNTSAVAKKTASTLRHEAYGSNWLISICSAFTRLLVALGFVSLSSLLAFELFFGNAIIDCSKSLGHLNSCHLPDFLSEGLFI